MTSTHHPLRRLAVALAATTILLAGTVALAPAAGAASTDRDYVCIVERNNDQRCYIDTGGIPQSLYYGHAKALTLWENGTIGSGNSLEIWIDQGNSGDTCSATTGDIDAVIYLPGDFNGIKGFQNVASSVDDIAARHCDWQLVGSGGARSTWVQNDYAPLSQLGNGWDNRSVRVRLT